MKTQNVLAAIGFVLLVAISAVARWGKEEEA